MVRVLRDKLCPPRLVLVTVLKGVLVIKVEADAEIQVIMAE